jgi:hypothetical protein
MRDKRRVQRTRALKGAKIILNNHSSVFDCTVHNLTNVGACAARMPRAREWRGLLAT